MSFKTRRGPLGPRPSPRFSAPGNARTAHPNTWVAEPPRVVFRDVIVAARLMSLRAMFLSRPTQRFGTSCINLVTLSQTSTAAPLTRRRTRRTMPIRLWDRVAISLRPKVGDHKSPAFARLSIHHLRPHHAWAQDMGRWLSKREEHRVSRGLGPFGTYPEGHEVHSRHN